MCRKINQTNYFNRPNSCLTRNDHFLPFWLSSWRRLKNWSAKSSWLRQTYIKLLRGGARGVMVIVVGNGRGDTSSNPDCISHCTNTLGKCMNPTILLPAMGKIVELTRFFSLGEATSLGEGKLWIQALMQLILCHILPERRGWVNMYKSYFICSNSLNPYLSSEM